MADPRDAKDASPEKLTSKKTALAGVAAAFLVIITAIAYGTHPEDAQTATPAQSARQQTVNIKTPLLTQASLQTPNQRPALALKQTAPDGQSSVTLLRPEQMFDFIVRFQNDIPELEACSKLFRTDETAARDMFSDWAKAHPPLARLTLKSVSYSGEMVLSWETGLRRPLLRLEVDQKLALIKSMAQVRYADPDYSVTSQGKK